MTQKPEHVGRRTEQEIEIDATALDVWKAWTDPEAFAQWFMDRAEGTAEAGETVTWHFDHFGFHQPLECVESVPGESVAYLVRFEGRLPMLVEITLEQEGGATRVRVCNSGFGEGAEWDQEYEGNEIGWAHSLTLLKHWLEHGRRAGPRAHVLATRDATCAFDALAPLFGTPEGLTRWLADDVQTSGASPGLEPGAEVRLALRGGGTLSGRVAVRRHHELMLQWDEQNAFLALKAYQGPEGPQIALDFNAWPLAEGETEADLKERFDAALGRLAAAVG